MVHLHGSMAMFQREVLSLDVLDDENSLSAMVARSTNFSEILIMNGNDNICVTKKRNNKNKDTEEEEEEDEKKKKMNTMMA